MSQTLLSAAWRLENMVGRQNELDCIKQAIYQDTEDQQCRVVLLTGPGGIGKSRLLEEVQWRVGHPQVRANAERKALQPQMLREDWTRYGFATISDVIDLMDIRFSAKTQLLQAIRDALARRGGVDFQAYEAAMRAYLRDLANSASFTIIKSGADAAEKSFWEAYAKHAQERRIVLLLDTAERLVLRSSEWLIKRKLLKPDELIISSQQWLLKQLRDGRFANSTLIIAGRDGKEEGGPFLDQIRATVNEAGKQAKLVEVKLEPLDEDETIEYFRLLAKEWQVRAQTSKPNADGNFEEYAGISRTMQAMADDIDRLRVLHLMTGGRPVLLSLYGDLIHEASDVPPPLQLSVDQARQAIEEKGGKALQSSIEHSFIDLLFRKRGLRSQIMRALARCPAGLSARQLHYVIDSESEEDPAYWEPDIFKVREIKRHLQQIGMLSIARLRRDDPLGLQEVIQRKALPDDIQRMGLQDEIYRIYAARMGETEDRRSYEHEERVIQYEKLSRWAAWRLRELRNSLRGFQSEDERRLITAIQLPTQAVRPRIPVPPSSEQEARSEIQQAIRDWELEKLHYDMLADPTTGLNDDYTDLTESRWLANNEEADFVAQQEMWRVLHDRHALRFTGLKKAKLDGLRRTARDEDLARWIKRFILRRDYKRAVNLYNSIKTVITSEPDDERDTLNHPLNLGERMIWRDYAQIMQAKKVEGAADNLEKTLQKLVKLANSRPDELVESAGVTGFIGHDALPRLYKIISVGYNFAGYGRVVLGRYGEAVIDYGNALYFMRKTRFKAQLAGTLNNLGRALASLGREERGYRVCADGLDLRRSLGAEIPIAYSLNTLALIGNSIQRTPTAWREAAQAAAIFRRSRDNRGLGLALIQLGIGLRRLANSRGPGVVLEATPEELYATAQDALGEAVEIFTSDPEVLRLVEARLEFGCLLRDQMRLIDFEGSPHLLVPLHRDAEIELIHAIELARKHQFKYLELQATVDLAWAHFFAKDYDRAKSLGEDAQEMIPQNYLITQERLPDASASESHYFYQLAKLHGLYAGIAMESFKKRRSQLRSLIKDRDALYKQLEHDKKAEQDLAAVAEGYVLSLYYGQMFSPRSRSLVITFDQIYEHVKSFNMVEYTMFRNLQARAVRKYDIAGQESLPESDKARPYDFSYLQYWLNDCFGPVEVKDA